MTIKDFQQNLADRLNQDQVIADGGCLAIAEDQIDAEQQAQRQLFVDGGVLIAIVTPELRSLGTSTACETTVEVQCCEIPFINRETSTHITALDAACRAAYVLGDAADIEAEFTGVRQQESTDGSGRRFVVATATFSFSFTFEPIQPQPPPPPDRLATPVLTIGSISRDGTEAEILSNEVPHAMTYVFRLMDESGTELVPPLESMIPSAYFDLLTPGTAYKVDCVAKAQGYEDSLPSTPLTFTTPN